MTTICLIGSARFSEQFFTVDECLTLGGHVVLTKDPNALAKRKAEGEFDAVDVETMHMVHMQKIMMADVVVVIDGEPTFSSASSYDPYIGESTAREILWAKLHERPMISLLSSSGWGNIAEMIAHRYDDAWFADHQWLSTHAAMVLKTKTGVGVVQDQIHERQLSLLHATLSVIACQTGTVATLAEAALIEAGLDPMEDVIAALAGTKILLPDEMTIYTPIDVETLKKVAETEVMTAIEHRKLVGACIMVDAINDMLLQKPKLSRRSVSDKLIMCVDTLRDAFGVTTEEIREVLGDRVGEAGFTPAEVGTDMLA